MSTRNTRIYHCCCEVSAKYLLLEKKGTISIVMHKDSTTTDVMQGFIHALVMANLLDHKDASLHIDSQTWMDKHYEAFILQVLFHIIFKYNRF